MQSDLKVYAWNHADEKSEYLISTRARYLDYDFINAAYATDDMYWAKPLPPAQLSLIISSSRVFGIYELSPTPLPTKSASSLESPREPSPTPEAESANSMKQIGFARFITDHVTFVYIGDVYIADEYRGRGLAKWLMTCFDHVLKDMPMLATTLLLTSPGKMQEFYSRELGFKDMRDQSSQKVIMTRNIVVKES